MTARSTHVARVKRGAAWLDANKPGWERVVSLPALDMASRYHCVLGQVFEQEAEAEGYCDGFEYGTELLPQARTAPDQRPVRLGFDIEGTQPDGFGDYSILHDLWVKEIGARLGG